MDTTTGMRISDVAERTGFSGPTLRYYEDIGLLPPPDRTGAGYRVYRERDVARLEFVARAKRLGCSLEEIRGLLEAWDEDRCAPVQHRLRSLVGQKPATPTQIGDLMEFSAELQRTATQLASEPVDGACGDGCACVGVDRPSGQTARAAVPLGMKPDGAVPVACSLDGADMAQRIEDWQDVTRLVERREALDGGIRLVFGDTPPLGEICRLAREEHACCPFFAFALTIDARGTALEVTAPPEGADILAAAFGTAA